MRMRWAALCGVTLWGAACSAVPEPGELAPAARQKEDAGEPKLRGFTDPEPGAPGVPGPQPDLGPTVSADDAPPPISGGTLAIAPDGHTAIAADPDRDLVHVVDLTTLTEVHAVVLAPHDEPGRVAVDDAGRAHVALRRGGALATIDIDTGTLLARRPVCAEPRGVAVDDARGLVHVACATGELVTFPAQGGAPTRTLRLERDLRDVLVRGTELLVSRFRSAELLVLDDAGTILSRRTPPGGGRPAGVAWRTVLRPDGSAWMLHQRSQQALAASAGGYGGGCVFAVETVVSTFPASGAQAAFTPQMGDAVLGVDVAQTLDGRAVVAAPGNALTWGMPAIVVSAPETPPRPLRCSPQLGPPPPKHVEGELARVRPSEPISIAVDGLGRIVAFSREPARIEVSLPTLHPVGTVPLAGPSRVDTGHDVFHQQAGGAIACASCHPEGGEDGRVWTLGQKRLRTPSLRGTLAGTAPYHWEGDQADISMLADEVYSGRMLGASLDAKQKAAAQRWLERIPRPGTPSVDAGTAAAAARGKVLFEGSAKCSTCHTGPMLTDNRTVEVGAETPMQVPSLVGVGARAPFMHDGCATTLRGRFEAQCRPWAHGPKLSLQPWQIDDLVAYLETL